MTKPEARFKAGFAMHRQGRLAEAELAYEKVLRYQPNHFDALHLLGVIGLQTERQERGVELISQAVRLNGTIAAAHDNRGRGLAALNRFDEAIASYDRAIALQPDYAEAFSNRGTALLNLQRLEDAVVDYGRAIALKPDFAMAHFTRGNALRDLQRHEEALTSYQRAIALKPDFAEACWNQSLCHLAMGDYARGWRQHEWRWRAELAHARPNLPGHPWLGDLPVEGKTVLVLAEQGLGDSVQFCRYLPMLAARANVVLEIPRALLRLLGGLEGVSRVITSGDPRPAFDVWTPMMSLPLAFRTTLETIPSQVPYLHADARRVAAWRDRLDVLPGRKVGIVWAGATRLGDPRNNSLDSRRSITLQEYAPLAAVPGLCLISLQKGEPAAQALTPPAGMVLHDWTDELEDLADTAALVEALDLIISVDTSVVHVAGALGKPIWVLNRYDQCWRWLRRRTDSPWYPSARLFQQRVPGDWSGVIDAIVAALRAQRR